MTDWLRNKTISIITRNSAKDIIICGFIFRLIWLTYGSIHDHYIDHIKYTDIDFHVFNDGAKAIANGGSPYRDNEYRYSPLVAILFVPSALIGEYVGKLGLITADVLCAYLIVRINIHQGTNRFSTKLFLIIWYFCPLTFMISTRGSFEPILLSVLLAAYYLMINNIFIVAGLLYGLSIHLKLYPIIYALSFYIYLINRKPYLRTQTKFYYWLKTLSPGISHFKFFISAALSLLISSYFSYRFYGHDYLEQSFLYHLRRIDLAPNFSVYWYLFKLLPNYQRELSLIAFALQFIGILVITILYASFDSNKRVKLRKLSFSLFSSTMLFVSLNKVCTSQYFNWYFIFVPLILDSLKIDRNQAVGMAAAWILSQVNWLLFAYLRQYQGFDTLNHVGNSSILFLISNLWIINTFCCSFDATAKRQTTRNEDKDQ